MSGVLNLRCILGLRLSAGYFWSIWSNYGLRQIEAIPYSFGLFEAQFAISPAENRSLIGSEIS